MKIFKALSIVYGLGYSTYKGCDNKRMDHVHLHCQQCGTKNPNYSG